MGMQERESDTYWQNDINIRIHRRKKNDLDMSEAECIPYNKESKYI